MGRDGDAVTIHIWLRSHSGAHPWPEPYVRTHIAPPPPPCHAPSLPHINTHPVPEPPCPDLEGCKPHGLNLHPGLIKGLEGPETQEGALPLPEGTSAGVLSGASGWRANPTGENTGPGRRQNHTDPPFRRGHTIPPHWMFVGFTSHRFHR